MKHIVSLSGGVSSAVAADLVINKHGKENVTLWFADTSWEDEDLYRFLGDLEKRWGLSILYYRDGRTPLEVFENENIIPNTRVAPCTRILKIDPFVKFLKAHEKPVTVHLGIGWDETHRMDAPRRNYEALAGVSVEFPLLWKPIVFNPFQLVESWGIQIPRLYSLGFPHNNCGGRCVKQGIREWRRLRAAMPERFAEVREWEDAQRAQDEKKKDYAILKDRRGGQLRPMPLAELDQRVEDDETGASEDLFSCFCSY